MKIKFDNKNGVNLYRFLRKCGYRPRRSARYGPSFIKSIGGRRYPHFHIYPKEENEHVVLLLHWDEKEPSYPGAHAHNAKYSGERVENEASLLQSLLAERDIKAEIEE